MHLDNLLEHLNPYGPFQIITWLVLSFFTCMPPAWHQFAITFTAFRPSNFGCTSLSNTSHIAGFAPLGENGTLINVHSLRLPIEGQQCSYTLAHYNDNSTDATLLGSSNETCTGGFWYAENDPIDASIIKQWDLVCAREYLYEIISTAEGTGEVIGCIIFGWIADRFGRKVGFFGAAAGLFASGLLCAFAPHPVVAIIARFGIGIGLTGMNNIGFLLNAELFTPNARTVFSTGGELMWSFAVVSLTGIGYLFRDSISFMIAITAPILILAPFWWFLNESLHWNLSRGYVDRAKASLEKIARFNKVKLDQELVQRILEEDVEHERELIHSRKSSLAAGNSSLRHPNKHVPPSSTKEGKQLQHLLSPPAADTISTVTPAIHSGQPLENPVKTSLPSSAQSFSQSPFSSVDAPHHKLQSSSRTSSSSTLNESGAAVLDLFRTPRLRLITIVITLLWFANTMCYYGLQLAAQDIEGVDFYLSFFILAVVEVPSIFVIMPSLHWLGRRWTIIVFQLLGGISIVGVSFIPPGNEILTISIAAFGKFAVCSSFTALYVYAVELFPTIIRGTGFGLVSVIGRIGMIVAPLINTFGYGDSSVPSWLRNVIYGASMILTVFLTLPLPETNHQPLADTIDEMENYAQYCQDYHKTNGPSANNNNHVAIKINDGDDEM